VSSTRFPFEGGEFTASEIARRCPAYSRVWLAKALKSGCRTVQDLAKRYATAQANHRQSCIRRSSTARKMFR